MRKLQNSRQWHTGMEQGSPSTIASYLQSFQVSLEERGIDPAPLFKQVGVAPITASDPLLRISHEKISELFTLAVEITGEPAFGIVIGSHMVPSNLHALGFGLLASSTLRDFFTRISRYYHIVSRSADFIQYDEGETCVLAAANISPTACPEQADTWVALMVKLMRLLYSKDLNPVSISLKRAMPEESRQAYYDYFLCPVHFECEQPVSIALDMAIMDVPLPGASRELALSNDQVVCEYLERQDKLNIVSSIRKYIVANLSSGRISHQETASSLQISSRTMQSRLSQQGTSFQEILDSVRREMAGAYLEQSHLAITEIAYLLGFADASNFTRAFRRWHGQSPRSFRTAAGTT